MTRILVVKDNEKALGKGMHGEVYACSWQGQGDDQKWMVVKVPKGTNCPKIISIEDEISIEDDAHTKGFFISRTTALIKLDVMIDTNYADFKREWDIAERLQYMAAGQQRPGIEGRKHIAHYIAFGSFTSSIQKKEPCLVMQMYAKTLTDSMLTDKDLRWQTVLEHVLLAIDYITLVCGVQHHDIRTDNIMTDYGAWYVCDFGEAKIEEGKRKREEMRRDEINFFATNLYKKLIEYKGTNQLSNKIFTEPRNEAPYLYYLQQCAKLQNPDTIDWDNPTVEAHEELYKKVFFYRTTTIR